MKKPITISLSPNTTAQDIKNARQLLFTNKVDTHPQERLTQLLSRHLQGAKITLTSSGRQALFDIMRALQVQKTDEIIMQAFTCIAVPAPVIWAGAIPVYADIDATTYNVNIEDIRQKITPNTKAIIVQHTFGIPAANIAKIAQLAKEKSIVLIEDCAHAIGATIDGKPVGTFGDIAFFSFGRDKVISSVFGGAVATNNHKIHSQLHSYQKSRPMPPAAWVRQQLFHPIFFNSVLPWYFTASLGKIAIVIAQQLNLISKAVASEEKVGKKPNHIAWQYSPKLAGLAVQQLERLLEVKTQRTQIAQRYQQVLEGITSIQLPSVTANVAPAWLRFPIQVNNPKELLQKAKKQSILLGDWYDAPLAPSNCTLEAFGYQLGSCPIAEEVAKKVINLPTYPRLTQNQVEQVIELVKKHAN